MIFGEIGWDVDAADLVRQILQLRQNGITDVNLYITSNGGSVFDGISLYNALKMMNTTVYIYGWAASIATVIAMAGKKVIMGENSFFMIHNPSGAAMGGSDDMKRMAGWLDEIKTTIVSAYKSRTNLSDEQLSEMMNSETLMNAEKAKEFGFVDEIMNNDQAQNHLKGFAGMVANALADKFGIKSFNNITEDNDMKLSKEALQALGLSEDATEQEINAERLCGRTIDRPH